MSWPAAIFGVLVAVAALAGYALVASWLRRSQKHRTHDDLESHQRSIVSLCHQLRTPLNAMAGSVSVLESKSLEVRQHAIAVIERNVRIEAALIDQLLSESRHLSGAAPERGPNGVGQAPDAAPTHEY